MNDRLYRLRLPGGCAVTYNSAFADVPMEVRDGQIVNFDYHKEDLLMIRQITTRSGDWQIDPAGWLVDLGWYPDSDPEGAYTINVVRGNWDELLFRVTNRDGEIIRTAIERILDGLTRGQAIPLLCAAVDGELPEASAD